MVRVGEIFGNRCHTNIAGFTIFPLIFASISKRLQISYFFRRCVNDGECLAPSCRPRRYYDYGEGTCLSHDHPRREKYSSRVNRGHVGHAGQREHEGVAEGVVGSGEGIDERT